MHRIAVEHASRCPLWVKSRHFGMPDRCPLTPQKRTLVERVGTFISCGRANYLPPLNNLGLGHLAVSSGNQTFGDQQKSREYQGVNHRDRDYADGKTTVVVVEFSTQYIAKSCHDYIESAGHHEHRSLQSRRTGPNN